MKGRCEACEKRVRGIKRTFSWGFFWITALIGGWLWYPVYRILFVRANRCPICGLKIKRC